MAHYVQAILDDTVPGGATAQEPRWEVAESSWIGYHWRVQDRNGHRMINHSGGTSTASIQLIVDKEAGKAVMVCSNTGFTGPSIPELTEHLLYGSDKHTPYAAMATMMGAIQVAITAACVLFLVFAAVRGNGPASRLAAGIRSVEALSCLVLAWTFDPWGMVPGWLFGIPLILGGYAIARTMVRWRDLPSLPGKHLWYFYARIAVALAVVAVSGWLVWPKY